MRAWANRQALMQSEGSKQKVHAVCADDEGVPGAADCMWPSDLTCKHTCKGRRMGGVGGCMANSGLDHSPTASWE